MSTFTPDALRALTTLIVRRMGSAAEETEEVADHLVRANLSGHDSHGVGMLPAYVRLLQDGLLVPNQTPHTVLDAGALLVIDARRGFGQRMTADAVRRAIGRARELGACVLALRNASHVGRIGTYARARRARRLRLHRLRQRRRWSRHPGAVGLRRTASRHQPVLCRGSRAGRAVAAARHGDHHDRRRQGAGGLQQGRAGAGRLPDRRRGPADQRSRGLHPRPHRRDAVVRPAQGVGPGGDVRDHGRRDRRRAARGPAGRRAASSTRCWRR